MKVVKINNIKMKSVQSEQIYIYAYIINYFLFLSFTLYWKVYCIILNCLWYEVKWKQYEWECVWCEKIFIK